MFGFLTHIAVNHRSAFGGDFSPCYFALTIHPNVDYHDAFFIEVVVRAVQRFGTTASKVIACAVPLAAIAFVLSDTSQTIGLALVTRLPCDTFRTTSLRIVVAFDEQLSFYYISIF